MFPGRDFQVARAERPGEQDLIRDLDLETIWAAMALGDDVVYQSSRSATLSGLTTVEEIRYRQSVLADCLQQPQPIRDIYALAVDAVAQERKLFSSRSFTHGETLLNRSITALEMFVKSLRQLRSVAEFHASEFRSDGFVRLFNTVRIELDDAYFDEIAQHLHRLRFPGGVLASAQLGDANQGIAYTLRTPRQENRGSFPKRRPAVKQPAYSRTIPREDHNGGEALGALRDRVLSLAAAELAQSADHVLSFFAALRVELGFYIGCLNLHDQLTAKGEPECLPDPHHLGAPEWSAQGLSDPCLSLTMPERVTANDLQADGKSLIIITGANQGGKSTFLRSLGVAQLMMQAGLPVVAESFSAPVVQGVFTHYKREEDVTMVRGKFDEELGRMSEIGSHISPHCLLLCNESFAATNEREGSEIAAEIIRALTHVGISVVFVTHLYELAHRLYGEHSGRTLFLRAERETDGGRQFRLTEAAPLPTSYGEDLFWQTFGGGPARSVRATVVAPVTDGPEPPQEVGGGALATSNEGERW